MHSSHRGHHIVVQPATHLIRLSPTTQCIGHKYGIAGRHLDILFWGVFTYRQVRHVNICADVSPCVTDPRRKKWLYNHEFRLSTKATFTRESIHFSISTIKKENNQIPSPTTTLQCTCSHVTISLSLSSSVRLTPTKLLKCVQLVQKKFDVVSVLLLTEFTQPSLMRSKAKHAASKTMIHQLH